MNASVPGAVVPLAETESVAPDLLGKAAAASEPARVLVVDDDERNLLAIRNVLEDLAEVVVAASGEEALRHLLKGEFAVILLDVFMPGMDGYETAQIIRGRDQTKRIPIVFLSAVNKETEHLIRGYTMGAVDYVFKPVEPVVLRSKVAVFVDLFEKTREIERKARQEQELLDAYRECREQWPDLPETPRLAVVDAAGAPTAAEFRLVCRFAEQAGLESVVATLDDLSYDGSRLVVKGEPAHLVARREAELAAESPACDSIRVVRDGVDAAR
jgi:CheY-like chemotaxis protein